jgi:lipid-binding SYLF domain-containing protein
MRKLIVVALAVGAMAPTPLLPEEQLIHRATSVLVRVLDAPAPAIPQSVLERARAIVIVPGGSARPSFGDSGSRMSGVLSARGASPDHWSPPAIVELRGAIAPTLDVNDLDVIVVAQTGRGLNALMADGGWLPGGVVIAAGPIAEDESVAADLVAYVRFENYFAGVTIDDWTIESAKDANAALYGKGYSTASIVRGQGFFHLRPAARAWHETLAELFGRMS